MLISLPDLHGRADLLEAAIRYYPEDTQFIFLGDAIDRGPNSRGVIRMLLQLIDERRLEAILGNHEWMLLQATKLWHQAIESSDPVQLNEAQEAWRNWVRNGGASVLQEYGQFTANNVPQELMMYLNSTQLTLTTSAGIFVSHAAPPYDETAPGDEVLWARPTDGPFALPGNTLLSVHGHTPLSNPTWVAESLFTDLGAVFTGALCTVDLESLEVIVLQGQGRAQLNTLPNLSSSEDGLVRTQAYRTVHID